MTPAVLARIEPSPNDRIRECDLPRLLAEAKTELTRATHLYPILPSVARTRPADRKPFAPKPPRPRGRPAKYRDPSGAARMRAGLAAIRRRLSLSPTPEARR